MIQILNDYGNTFLRRARKAHRCRVCPRPIERGSTYVENVDCTPAFQSGDRYHVDCAERQGLVREVA